MPIPFIDLGLIRDSQNQTTIPKFNTFPTEIVGTAEVVLEPNSFPIGFLIVFFQSSGWDDQKVGQLFRITRPTGEIVTWGVVRKPADGVVFYMDGKSRGDTGRSELIALGIKAGDIVTVYSIQPIWSLLSRIVDGVFYKKYDNPYDGSGSNPNPVCNIGMWRSVDVNRSTGYATVTFNNTNSFAWLGKSITSYTWTLPPEAIIVSGSLSSSSITIKLPQGFYVIRCFIVDSGSAFQEAMRPIWVNGDEYTPFSDNYAFEIGSDQDDRQGRAMSIKFYGDFPDDVILPGAPILFTEYDKFDSSETSEGVHVVNFAGFVSDDNYTFDAYQGEKSLSMDIKSPYKWMEKIPMVSQEILETDGAIDSWEKVSSTLGNPSFIAWYILKHHTTYLELFDFYQLPEDDPPRKRDWALNGNTIADYLAQSSKIIGGNIGTTSDGAMRLMRDPSIEENDYRVALDTRMTITDTDLTKPIEIVHPYHKSVGQLRAYALMYDGNTPTAYASIAPGLAQAQAPGSQTEDSFIVKPPNGQLRINRISGHLFAKQNSPTPEIVLDFVRNYDVIEPAKMLWYILDISAAYNPKGVPYTTRMVAKSVSRTWENVNGSWVKNISATFEPETFGQPGDTLPIIAGGGGIDQPELIQLVDPPPIDELGGFVFSWTGGAFGRTFNGENWEDVRSGVVDGLVNDMTIDKWSPFVTSGYSQGNLGAWVASTETNNVHIYYTQDALAASIIWEEQTTISCDSVELDKSIRIISSEEVNHFCACTFVDDTGVKIARTYDGSTWTLDNVDDGTHTQHTGFAECGFDMLGQKMVVSGLATADSYELYYCTTYNGTFQKVNNTPVATLPFPVVEIVDDFNVYTTAYTNVESGSNDRLIAYAYQDSFPLSTEYSTTGNYAAVSIAPAIPNALHLANPTNSWKMTYIGPTDHTPSDFVRGALIIDIYIPGTASIINASLAFTYKAWNDTPLLNELSYQGHVRFDLYDNVGTLLEYSTNQISNALSTLVPTGTVGGDDLNLAQDIIDATVSPADVWKYYPFSMRSWVNPVNGHLVSTFSKTSNYWVLTYPSTGGSVTNVSHVKVTITPGAERDSAGSGGIEYLSSAYVVLNTTEYSVKTPRMYYVEDYYGADPTWNNITLSDRSIAFGTKSISVDPINKERAQFIVSAVDTDGNIDTGTRNFTETSDRTATAIPIGDSTNFRGCQIAGRYGLYYGDSSLALTEDGGDNFESIIGDWAQVFGSLGTFRGAIAVF